MLLEVLADAERAAGPGQHDAAHGRVVGHLAHGREQGLLGHDVEAVHRLGSVEGDGRDAVGDLEQDGGDVMRSCAGMAHRVPHRQRRTDEPVGRGLEPRRLVGEQAAAARPGQSRAAARPAARGRRRGTCATRGPAGTGRRTPPRPRRRAGRLVSTQASATPGHAAYDAARAAGPRPRPGRVEARPRRSRDEPPARSTTSSHLRPAERAQPHARRVLGVARGSGAPRSRSRPPGRAGLDEDQSPPAVPGSGPLGRSGRPPRRAARSPAVAR